MQMSAPTLPTLEPQPAVSPSYKWWVVFMLWFICFFNYADRQAISVVLPKLQEEFRFDKEMQGYIASAFMWVYAAGAPIAGYIGDRFMRKYLILGGCLFWSLVTGMTGWCRQFWQFATVRALEGFGETFYFPASMSLVSDYHTAKTRSRAMSFHQSSVYIGTIGGSWLAAYLAEYHNWRWGFYFFGFAGVVLAVVLFKFLREPARGSQGEATPTARAEAANMANAVAPAPLYLAKLFLIPALLLLFIVFWGQLKTDYRVTLVAMIAAVVLLVWGLWRMLGELRVRSLTALMLLTAFIGANSVATIFLIWTPTFLIDKFGFKLTSAGLTGSVFIQVGSALSVPLGGLLADWLSRRFHTGRMLVQIGGLLAGSAFVFLVGTTINVHTLILAMGVFGFCKGLYDSNIFASLYDVVPVETRAAAAGIMNFVGWGGGALGPIIFGWMAKNGAYGSEVENMSHTIAAGGGVYLLSAALILIAVLFFAKRDVEKARAEALSLS